MKVQNLDCICMGLNPITESEALMISGGSGFFEDWAASHLLDWAVGALWSTSKASADRETTRPKGVVRYGPGI